MLIEEEGDSKYKSKPKTLRKIEEVIDSGLWDYLRADVKEWYINQTGKDYSKPKHEH